MGIFSRLFQRGQDGGSTDVPAGDAGDDGDEGADGGEVRGRAREDDDDDEPEIMLTKEKSAPVAAPAASSTPAAGKPAAAAPAAKSSAQTSKQAAPAAPSAPVASSAAPAAAPQPRSAQPATNAQPAAPVSSGAPAAPGLPGLSDESAVPHAPKLPGLTPAYAGAAAASGTDSGRSIWDWPGPQRERRSSDRASTPSPDAAPAATPDAPRAPGGMVTSAVSGTASGSLGEPKPAPAKPRTATPTPSPSEPTSRTAEPEASASTASTAGKDRAPTIVVSPPPAPGQAALPGLPPRATKPASTPPATPAAAKAKQTTPSLPAAAPAASTPPPASPPPAAASPSAPPAAPPPAASTPAAAAAPPTKPPARASASSPPPRRAHSDSVGQAFDQAFDLGGQGGGEIRAGAWTAADLAEVRRTFNAVAAVHVSQVRDVMLELRYGDAQPAWVESTQPALRSLRQMASQVELADLCTAIDEFCAAVDSAASGRARLTDDGKSELLRRYAKLIEIIPEAFELDAERDRREPVIVQALLYQIEGVEKRTIEKLFAVGLHRLEVLTMASAEEIAVVAGIRPELATAIAEQFRSYKNGASSLSSPDPLAERRQLGDLLIMLSVQNDEYAHHATKWTDEARARKREARKQREQVFQRIKVALARLGERDQLAKIEKMSFDEVIATLDRYLSAAIPSSRGPGKH